MTAHPIQRWHEILERKDARALASWLAEDAVFWSPVVHTPQHGRAITAAYLTAAFEVFGDESFKYVREIVTEHDAVLEFELTLDGTLVNGVDMIRWNEAGQVTEFKVMLRPLKAVNLIHQRMAAMLQAQRQQQ